MICQPSHFFQVPPIELASWIFNSDLGARIVGCKEVRDVQDGTVIPHVDAGTTARPTMDIPAALDVAAAGKDMHFMMFRNGSPEPVAQIIFARFCDLSFLLF